MLQPDSYAGSVEGLMYPGANGLHFKLYESEMSVINQVAQAQRGVNLDELPLGRAAVILRTFVMTAAGVSKIYKMNQPELESLHPKTLDREISRAVLEIGRITITIFSNTAWQNGETEQVGYIELLSS